MQASDFKSACGVDLAEPCTNGNTQVNVHNKIIFNTLFWTLEVTVIFRYVLCRSLNVEKNTPLSTGVTYLSHDDLRYLCE